MPVVVSRTNNDKLVNKKDLYFAQNELEFAEDWISTPQLPSAGANWEAI